MVTEMIETYIADFEASAMREDMEEGNSYYRSENTEIMDRKFYIYAEDDTGNPVEIEDPYKANNKLASGYFKLLVDQKVNYLLGNQPTVTTNQDLDILDNIFFRTVKKTGKEASKKIRGWLQPYIDSEGNFDYKRIPTEQVVPVYKANNANELEFVIRYYSVTVLNQEGNAVKVNRVEVWDDEEVTYYQESTFDGLYRLLDEGQMEEMLGSEFPNPKYHFQRTMEYGQTTETVEELSWGKPPFIPLENNDELTNDLKPVKSFIDAYDIVKSDFVNNLEDFQDVYWILKGYEGQNLNEFLEQVKKYRSLKVAEDGDARAETIDIPEKARKEALEGLERDIFTFGQGVNPNELSGGNITNVVIKSRFANLDLKADQFEDEIRQFIEEFIDFYNIYREMNNEPPIEIEDMTFNRSMIMNEVEMAQLANQSKGSLSEETRLSNDPRVDDPEDEIERMNNETANYISLGGENE